MSRIGRLAASLANRIDDSLDRARRAARARSTRVRPYVVVPYAGYGTATRLTLTGRVIVDKGLGPSAEGDSWRTTFRNTIRRLESDEVPGAVVRARFADVATEVVADDEGYFTVDIVPPAGSIDDSKAWHEVGLELVAPATSSTAPPAIGRVLVPPASARFGVISDIDDTVIPSNVTNKLRMLKIVFFESARMRLPFEGTAALYRALQSGATGAEKNPIFYVSGSPWNLYDVISEIFDVHGIPTGPIRLRDFGAGAGVLIHEDTESYKRAQIRNILETYPDLPFVLIGDSGEKDPEIYRSIVRDFPARILAAYIRRVEKDPARDAALQTLVAEAKTDTSEIVLAPDTRAAADHAVSRGFISASWLEPVEASVAQDRASEKTNDAPPIAERPAPAVLAENE